MALPSYVIQKNIRGDSANENVVLLNSTTNQFIYLVWDDLDQYAQDKFDQVYTSGNLIPVLKNTRFRNQSFYSYLSYAILTVRIGPSGAIEPQNFDRTVYDPSTNNVRVGRYSGNHELATYTTTNVFSYLSVYGTSRIRDVITTTGTGSTSAVDGKIRLNTGTTAASSTKIETVERGRYIPGKSSEGGVGVWLVQPLTGDQTVTIELGDELNAARFVIEANDTRIETVRDGVIVSSVSQKNWNLNPADGSVEDYTEQSIKFQPSQEGYIYTFLFNWYGIGKVIYGIGKPYAKLKEPLTSVPVHEFIPSEFNYQSFIDPNLPITVIVDNGTTAQNVQVDIGGRRYDVLGEFKPEFRPTTALTNVTSLSSRSVVLGLRRKADYPAVGRNNTVPVYLKELQTLLAGGDGLLRVYSVPRGTLSDNWGDLPEINSQAETSLEINTVVNDITAIPQIDKFLLEGPEITVAGNRGGLVKTEEKGIRSPLIRDEELVIEIDPEATVDGRVILTMLEEF